MLSNLLIDALQVYNHPNQSTSKAAGLPLLLTLLMTLFIGLSCNIANKSYKNKLEIFE